jgi:hypothetical protein
MMMMMPLLLHTALLAGAVERAWLGAACCTCSFFEQEQHVW